MKEEVLKWYCAILLMDVDKLNWEIVKTQFEQDFRAAPKISTVISRLQDIKQKRQ
jgi:hypothetical protein